VTGRAPRRTRGDARSDRPADELMDTLADGPTEEHPGEPAGRPPRSRGRRARRVLLTAVGMLCSLVLLAAGGLYVLSDRLAGNVERIPGVFAGLDPAQRPPKPAGLAGRAETFLLAGRDSRSPEPSGGAGFSPGGQRSDVLMLVRVNAARTEAVVVSIPRDSWVPIPGRGMAKINAAYAFGGPGLAVETVEALTGIRVDHFATVDFAGFEAVVDAVGGIEVTLARATAFGDISFHAGVNHLDGRRALAYVRQRDGLPRGDLDRVRRQQSALRALLTRVASTDLLGDPLRLYDLLDAVTRWVEVDDTMSNGDLRSLALDLRHLRGPNVTFLTSPVARTGWAGNQSVVYLDPERGPRLWQALDHDRIRSYLADNGADVLGGSPP
jgi:LCP family protein required for cell wall assembly